MRKAVFAGTFDPLTKGHEELVLRALSFFDEIVVAIGENPDKETMFTLEQRLIFLRTAFGEDIGSGKVSVASYSGLTGDFARSVGAGFLLRGVRGVMDFEYEKDLAEINRVLFPSIETVFLFSSSVLSGISSSVVRKVLQAGCSGEVDILAFVSEKILPLLNVNK
ncbi:MAG: pantetheine-phosphate adenylyltransferase [Bacteroidales bacterium]|jgi:pantetheine-phosphate adenylyltransferase|nr:pantetheine-phosphate adenylyltransferase [Bacteroidales bacterium]